MISSNIDPLKKVITEFELLRQENSRFVIAIDGRGGAGKSSLALSILKEIPNSFHIEYDWFHLPMNRVTDDKHYDSERFIKEVLNPFALGDEQLSFKKYNWGCISDGVDDGLDVEPTTIAVGVVLIVEGCDTLNVSLAPFIDLGIWIDTDPVESLRRGIKRDIEQYHLDPIKVNELWQEWFEWEENMLKKDDRRLRASLIL